MHLSARSFFPILSTLHSSDRWIFHRIFPLNVISLENSPKPIWKCFVMDFVLPVYPTKYSRTLRKKWDAIVEFVSNLPCKNVIFPLLLFSVLFIRSKRNDTSFLVTGQEWEKKDSLYVTLLTPKIKLSQASQENVPVTYFCSTKTFLLRKSNENWACL